MDELRLSITGTPSPEHWRWLLSEADTGNPLADFEAAVDRDAFEFAGFDDLHRFLRWTADPGRRVATEAMLVKRVGAWIGEHVLGGMVTAAMIARAPVTVRVVLPESLAFLVYRPLELAHVNGRPIVSQDVSFVFELPGPERAGVGFRKDPIGDRLRILAVFSLPTDTSVLGLRRERYELTHLVRRLAARSGRAIELEVLQYGVTRDRLRNRALEGAGWDILHISGHGLAGGLLLEKADGGPDLLDAGELVTLLRPARSRLKLAVVSTCQSGAASAAEALRWLRLEEVAEELEQQAAAEVGVEHVENSRDEAVGLSGVARELGGALDCAVVAMRYPVVDDFAVHFADQLYTLLLEHGQPVDMALPLALAEATQELPSPAAPAISLATPALFGSRAVGLVLQPPAGRGRSLEVHRIKMASFPDEPERFVGRSGPMAEGSAALAPRSERVAVLLHGMAGAGKTACALELAYRHQSAFEALAFWEAPKETEQAFTALPDLAQRLEDQLAHFGFAMVDKVGSVADLKRFLPQLTELLQESGLLIVLDNLETLLDEQGHWRDQRWPLLIQAFTSHGGESRAVFTSRLSPAGLDGAKVLTVPVHALSLTESVLLARELPHLGEMLGTETSVERGSDELDAGRELVRRVLHVVQGHPKLLELADASAADPAALTGLLDAAQAVTDQGPLGAFFTRGASELDPEQFFAVLTAWTVDAASALPADSRLLLELLCCAEDGDRSSLMLEGNWTDLWRRLQRPGDPPQIEPALRPLLAGALVQRDVLRRAEEQSAEATMIHYRIHPGVAEVVRTTAPPAVKAAVDRELGVWWASIQHSALEREGGEASDLVVRAGLAAAPYLLRLQDWDAASNTIGAALLRDKSPATVRTGIAHLQRIWEATADPAVEWNLGRALRWVDPDEAEQRLQHAINTAVLRDDYGVASGTASSLANLLRSRGRLYEALEFADQAAEYTHRAGLGPWTQLGDASVRLQILSALGKHEEVLSEVESRRVEMAELPGQAQQNDWSEPFIAREALLSSGLSAATALGRWEQALELNAAILTSKGDRRAGDYAIAQTGFNACELLLRLGRLDEAEELLLACQQVFNDAGDTLALGRVFLARADLEYQLGHTTEAAEFQRRALRYNYVHPEPAAVAASHFSLANYLWRLDADTTGRLAHRIASVLLDYQTGTDLTKDLRALAFDIQDLGDGQLPRSFDQLSARVDQVDGAHFRSLYNKLSPESGSGDRALAEVLRRAQSVASDALARIMESWEPIIAGVVAAAQGDAQAANTADLALRGPASTQEWAALAPVLRRIMTGERDEVLLAGLDPADTAIVRRALDALSGTVVLNATIDDLRAQAEVPESWEPTIAGVVAAAQGDAQAANAADLALRGVADMQEWAALVPVLRRIMAGERDEVLLAGLDPVDTAIVRRALDALSGTVTLNATVEEFRAGITGSDALARTMEGWEQTIAGVVAAAQGDAQAADAADVVLRRLEGEDDWAALVPVLRRIMAGERDEVLLAGLDPVDTAIVRRALDALSGTVVLNVTIDDLRAQAEVPEGWEPMIAGVVAAAQGDAQAADAADVILRRLEGEDDWAALVPVLRRIMAGERDEVLLAGLDPVDTAIVRRALDALSGTVVLNVTIDDLRAQAEVPEGWEPMIAGVVAAAQGDAQAADAADVILRRLEGEDDWAALVPVLRRIMAGERDEVLLAGLDPVDTAIVRRALDALSGRP